MILGYTIIFIDNTHEIRFHVALISKFLLYNIQYTQYDSRHLGYMLYIHTQHKTSSNYTLI